MRRSISTGADAPVDILVQERHRAVVVAGADRALARAEVIAVQVAVSYHPSSASGRPATSASVVQAATTGSVWTGRIDPRPNRYTSPLPRPSWRWGSRASEANAGSGAAVVTAQAVIPGGPRWYLFAG